MSISYREIAAVLTGCILMVLAASVKLWYLVGLKILKRRTFLNEYQTNIIHTLLPTGIMVGAIIFSISADIIGRKMSLLAVTVPYVAAFTIFQLARSLSVVCIGQVMSGLAVGGCYVILPVYIGEISSPTIRGLLGALMSVFFFTGELIYRTLAKYKTYTIFNITSLSLTVAFFLIFLLVGPESPIHIKRKHGRNIRSDGNEEGSTSDNLSYVHSAIVMKCCGSIGWIKPVTMMIILIIVQHLSGIYLVSMLLVPVHKQFELISLTYPYEMIAVAACALQLLGSIMCALLVDKYGRKFCLIISTMGIGIIFIPIAVHAYRSHKFLDIGPKPVLYIFFVIAFLLFYSFGLNSVPQIMLGELFPYQQKMMAVAILVSIREVSRFVIEKYFQDISTMVGNTTILFVFMVSMIIASILLHFTILETKQKSLKDIQLALENK